MFNYSPCKIRRIIPPASRKAVWDGVLLLLLPLWMLLVVVAHPIAAAPTVLPGTQDLIFQVQLHASGSLTSVALQPDGKILVGGNFSDFNDVSAAQGLARLNADGSLDTSFQSGLSALVGVNSIVVQPDGKILVGGSSTSSDGSNQGLISRLNADGTLDASFASITLDDLVNTLALQPDGKVLLAGFFTNVNGVARNGLARLSADGSLDTSFDPESGTDGVNRALAVQADGKVLLGGDFSEVEGVPQAGIARLNADGSLDTSYQAQLPEGYGIVYSVALQDDGEALVGGSLSINSGNGNNLVRYNSDGTTDASFNAGSFLKGSTDGTPMDVLVLPSGGSVVIGDFTQVQGQARPQIVRLGADGSVDPAFVPPAGGLVGELYAEASAIALQANGKLVLAGSFVFVGGSPSPSVVRFNLDGSVDTSFNPGTGAGGGTPSGYADVLVVQPDGKVLVGGDFSSVNGVPCIGYARLNADGSFDTSFQTGTGTGATGPLQDKTTNIVAAFSVQPDDKIIVAGYFDQLNGQFSANIGRLNADGSVDTGFQSASTSGTTIQQDGLIVATALQPDGKVLASGSFVLPTPNLARYNADGSLDASFQSAVIRGYGLNAVVVQPDGKILIGGSFSFGSLSNAVEGGGVARLNPDGSVDASFNVGAGVTGAVFALALQPDGRIVIGGEFTAYNNVPRNGVARLNADGSLDTSFYAGIGPDTNSVENLALQSDGSILVRGNFNTFSGIALPGLVQLDPDGSLNYGFVPGLTLGGSYGAFALQSDGNILTGINDGQVISLEGGAGHPLFFAGEQPVGDGFYYLLFPNGNQFGYYTYAFFPYLYHADLGFEYFLDAGDAAHGAYLYDFASGGYFYTSPGFPFPYFYDFTLGAVLYYYPDATSPGHYTSNPRYFYDFATGEIITK